VRGTGASGTTQRLRNVSTVIGRQAKARTYIDQCKALTECRRELPDMGELPANLQRWTLKRLDEAFQGFSAA